ncbi:hypothetical protein A1359_21355 [Methylomonas lenta]|uniref:Big-1 domain-containing protein n=1 Tax=Methylomonas lenta TaxID=980561 RepID=A0A177NSI2_9GAMM|nr:carboxypeptidase-like regulatory domain-containing protein [Methylomonas lenta]OAI20179.1 hypothetical protein A1359_21355 [Methylomonas lenta]
MSEKQHLLGKQPGNQSKPLYFSQYLTRVTVPISWVLSVLSLLLLLYLPQTVSAATAITWESLSTNQATIKLANPVRNRRSTDATVSVSLNNVSGSEITGPLRLVITNLTPTGKVSISNATGSTDTGEPYFDLTGYIGNNFTVGGSGVVVSVIVAGGGPNIFSFQARLERQVTQNQALTIKITSPATLLTIGHTPQTVQGTVSDPTAQVTLNGAPVNNSNGSFQADVALEEGHNTITARAINAKGEDITDAISLSLDMTPPYLTVESPKDGDTVRIDKIAVSGLINDIVRGTVADGQANVKVNGVAASVSNRSYLAENVALTEGDNTIKIDASDNVGNTTSLTIKVKYQPLAPQHIELLSGQNQAAKINATLVQPLKVKLLDGDNQPVANKPVIYRVTEGDGVVGAGAADEGQGVLVQTDALGVASTSFKLGSRAGTGNQRVRAASVGFDGEVLFYASATVGTGNKVTVNAGNNQRGAIGQPLSQPFVVAVVDDGANVVPGARIEFKVTQGSGKFQNDQTTVTSTTDSDGRATAEFTLGSEEGLDVHRVTATLVGTELYAGFTASALKTGAAGQTSISGVVMDNQEHPLPNVTVRVDGTTREAQTDAQGQFKITEAPVGTVHLIADGSTTTAEGEYPTLSFNLTTIAGADNPLSAPIYLVKLDTVNAKTVGDQDVTLTLPEVPGFALEVKAGSVTFPDGKKTGKLSVTPVNASKIPMAPPNGMQPQFIVTIQPVGAKFDPPAPLSLPNVDGHKPGAQVEMYSYDHDLEEFVAIGLGTVSTDGSIIKSNQGVGVIKAGWHCGSQPGGSGCCTSPGKCQATDASCNIVNKPKMADVTGDCQSPKDCESQDPNPGDVPKDVTGDCKKPICNGGTPSTENANDPPQNDKCKECNEGQVKDIDLDATKTTVAYTFSPPSESVKKINDGLEELTKIGVLASVNLLQIQGTLSSKECCGPETGKGTDVSGSVNGNFGGFSVKGKIWPPGPIPTFGPKTFNAGVASLTVKAQFVGGIFIGLTGSVSGEVGYKKNDCSTDPNDRNGCGYGQLNTSLTPSISAEIGGSGSLEFDCIFCVKETIEGSASLVAGELSWPLNLSAVGYNVANCSAGLTGGLFQFGSGSFKVGAKFSGSYQAEGGGKNTYDISFDFVSCEISSAGVNCS